MDCSTLRPRVTVIFCFVWLSAHGNEFELKDDGNLCTVCWPSSSGLCNLLRVVSAVNLGGVWILSAWYATAWVVHTTGCKSLHSQLTWPCLNLPCSCVSSFRAVLAFLPCFCDGCKCLQTQANVPSGRPYPQLHFMSNLLHMQHNMSMH